MVIILLLYVWSIALKVASFGYYMGSQGKFKSLDMI